MGEKIAWGSDSALMYEAADALASTQAALEPFAEEVARVEKSYAEFNSGNRSPLLLDDDSHYLGNRIRWRHLRAAAEALAALSQDGEEGA